MASVNDVHVKESRISKEMVWGIVFICVLPLALNMMGFSFASVGKPFDTSVAGGLESHELVDAMFYRLSGSFSHTLLEWSAFCTAIFTVFLAFCHFYMKRDITTPVIAVALFCSGAMDAFHTLAADRLIKAVADNRNLIPFTWAICRMFNALILIFGIGIFLVKKDEGENEEISRSIRSIFLIGLVFGCIAYAIIHFCATSAQLPQTQFSSSIVTRPYDVIPLILYVFAGIFVCPRFHKRAPSLFSHALLISIIPQIVTQLHMSFGSTALFDNHFNIAHFLKIIAYLVPFIGLLLDYIETYREEQILVEQLKNEVGERERGVAALARQAEALTRSNSDLERAEKQFRVVVDSSPYGMVMVDQDANITFVNTQTEALFGYTRGELIGQSIEILVPESLREGHKGYRRDYAEDPGIRSMGAARDMYGLRKDRKKFQSKLGSVPLRQRKGSRLWGRSSI